MYCITNKAIENHEELQAHVLIKFHWMSIFYDALLPSLRVRTGFSYMRASRPLKTVKIMLGIAKTAASLVARTGGLPVDADDNADAVPLDDVIPGTVAITIVFDVTSTRTTLPDAARE